MPIVSLGSDAVEVTEGGNAEIEVIRSGDPGVNITVLLTGTVVAGATNPAECTLLLLLLFFALEACMFEFVLSITASMRSM